MQKNEIRVRVFQRRETPRPKIFKRPAMTRNQEGVPVPLRLSWQNKLLQPRTCSGRNISLARLANGDIRPVHTVPPNPVARLRLLGEH